MKRFLALFLAAALQCGCVSALADDGGSPYSVIYLESKIVAVFPYGADS